MSKLEIQRRLLFYYFKITVVLLSFCFRMIAENKAKPLVLLLILYKVTLDVKKNN